MNLVSMLALLPHTTAEILAEALRHAICPEFARRVVEVRKLQAPRLAPDLWPWPVRIEVLRPFRIVVAGQPLAFTGKTQQKPLELLKYLACARDFVAESSSLAAALWPDGDDAAGKKNLEVTVSRLRKLLADETLVIVKDGKVALDAHRVSSDARELVVAIADAESVSGGARTKLEVERIGAQLLALFETLPLEQEESTAWREAVRERYRTAFVRAARTLIAYWTGVGEPARAVSLIEAALAREPLAENLYRTLIQIHLDAGNATEAMRVYRQCRQMLSVLIGAQPSPETESLRHSIVN
jgi:DNA-binding SARP family transcriptional activator